MDAFWNVLESQMTLILFFLIGLFLKRRRVLSDQGVEDLTALVVNTLLPISIFDSFQVDLTVEDYRTGGMLMIISAGICLMSYLMGLGLFCRWPEDKRRVMRYSALISNCTFVGLPLLSALYGLRGVFYASVFVIPNRFFMWSLGVMMFEKGHLPLGKTLRKLLLNPCIAACFLGLGTALLPVPLPRVLTRVTGSLGTCNGPMSMLTIGAILAQVDIRRSWNWDTLYISFVRLLLIPLAAQALLMLLGMDSQVVAVSVLLTGMPLANTVVLLAKRYNCQVELAAQATLVSVLLSLITVPVLTLLLQVRAC